MFWTVVATIIAVTCILIALFLAVFAFRPGQNENLSMDVPAFLMVLLGFFGGCLLLGVFTPIGIGWGFVSGILTGVASARMVIFERENIRRRKLQKG